MTFDISNLVSGGILKLQNPIDATTVNPTVRLYPASVLKVQVDNDPNNDVLLTELVASITAKKINVNTFLLDSESMWLTGGTEKTVNGIEVVEYAATVRGLFNANKNNPPTSTDGGSRNYKTHAPQDTCAIPEDYLIRYLSDLFTAGSVEDSAEDGEGIEIRRSVSIHTDGKLYKFDAVNYPNLFGISKAETSIGETADYVTFGGLSIGHSGLIVGATQYADSIPTPVDIISTALAGIGAGNVDDGDHDYKVTFFVGDNETDGGPVSGTVTVSDKTTNGQISLSSIPVSDNANVTARGIYRRFNGAEDYKLVTKILDNTTTTYIDNIANASLGDTIPTSNDCTGLIVETQTLTSKYLGAAPEATQIRIAPSTPSQLEKASTSDAITATNDTKYMTPLKVKESIQENSILDDLKFKLFNEENYIDSAPSAPLISEGSAGTGNYTSIVVKLVYRSKNGQFTEASPSSNSLGPVVAKKINIPVVASSNSGCDGIAVWINVDGAGDKLWQVVDNTTTTLEYNNESLTAGTIPSANGTKVFSRFNTEDTQSDIVLKIKSVSGSIGINQNVTSDEPETTTIIENLTSETIVEIFIDLSDVTLGQAKLLIDDVETNTVTAGNTLTVFKKPTSSVKLKTESIEFDISAMTFNQQDATTGNNVRGIYVLEDGSGIIVADTVAQRIEFFPMSTPFDVSTTGASTSNFSTGSNFFGYMAWKPDGTKVFLGTTDATILQLMEYTLTTPWDLSTASLTDSEAGVARSTRGIRFNDDGTKLFLLTASGAPTHVLHEYALSTAYDLTSINTTPTQSKTLPAGTYWDFEFVNDGESIVFIEGLASTGSFRQYNLTTAYDISTIGASPDYSYTTDTINKYGLSIVDSALKLYAHDATVGSNTREYDLASFGYDGDAFASVKI